MSLDQSSQYRDEPTFFTIWPNTDSFQSDGSSVSWPWIPWVTPSAPEPDDPAPASSPSDAEPSSRSSCLFFFSSETCSTMMFSGPWPLSSIELIAASRRSSCARRALRTCHTTWKRLLSSSARSGAMPAGTATGRMM